MMNNAATMRLPTLRERFERARRGEPALDEPGLAYLEPAAADDPPTSTSDETARASAVTAS